MKAMVCPSPTESRDAAVDGIVRAIADNAEVVRVIADVTGAAG